MSELVSAGKLSGKRILHILGDSAYGGGSKVVLNLVRAARQEGAVVEVLTTDSQLGDEVRAWGGEVVALDCIRRSFRPVRDALGLIRLWRFLKRSRFDVVHTHTSKAGAIGRLAATLARTPLVVHTVHGFAFHESSGRLATTLVVAVERMAATCCDLIVTVSRHHFSVAKRYGIAREEKLLAIPNGIPDPAAPDPQVVNRVRGEFLSAGAKTLVVCHGRLAEQKGIIYLIEALGRLRSEGRLPSDLVVVIAGDGPERESLEQRALSLGVEEAVIFAGFRTDVSDLVGSADVVVLPSLWEGLSISLMEAMALGRVIVTTNIPSNAEMLIDGVEALLVEPRDAVALAEALTRVVTAGGPREEFGGRARERFLREYSVEGMCEAYVGAYQLRRIEESRSIA